MAEHVVSIGRVRPAEVTPAHALDLVQRVAVDRLRLFQLDLEERARSLVRSTTFIGVGSFCLLVAWLGLLCAVVLALAERMPLSSSLLCVSASQVLLGAVLIAVGRARARP